MFAGKEDAVTRPQIGEYSVSTLFDRGGESHELIASYALELTPFVSAFNEAYSSRCKGRLHLAREV